MSSRVEKGDVLGWTLPIVCTMIAYKLKGVYDEDDTLNFSAMRQNVKSYPREENNLCYYSSMSLTYYMHTCDTVIAENTGGAKYRIYSRKTETATNITI